MPMPKYRCHKVVEAAQIRLIAHDVRGCTLFFERAPDGSFIDQVHVDDEWMQRHRPKPGGWFVKYADSYSSYSPDAAFQDGYALLAPPQPQCAACGNDTWIGASDEPMRCATCGTPYADPRNAPTPPEAA